MKNFVTPAPTLWRRLASTWRRLPARIYGFAILCLAMTTLVWVVLTPLFLDPQIKNVQLGVASYAIDDVAAHRQEPDKARALADKALHTLFLKITLYDSAGRVIVSNVEPALPPPTADEQQVLSTHGRLPGHGPRAIVALTPSDSRGELLYAVLELPTPKFFTRNFVGLLVAILVILAIVSLVFARRIVRPLAYLAQVARDLGAGNLQARASLDRDDELGDLARAFDDMAERIAKLLHAQKALLADVSHELRTPLARLRLALDIAAEDEHSDSRREELALLSGDLAELERLVADLLQVARLEVGDLGQDASFPSIRRELWPAGDLMEATAARFRVLYPGRPLAVDIAAPLPPIDCDPMLLRRAIDNLLDNAAKYSDSGTEVMLGASATESELAIEVVDQGIGMSASELEHAFTPFWRADRSRTRGTGGVGLGLALARRIAKAHGGDITLVSTPGQGTKARLLVPLD